jgi:O-antigen/teichoic acid export membrane protein
MPPVKPTRTVARYLPGIALSATGGLLFSTVFTRLLSPAEYGLYNIALITVTFLASFSSAWINQAINRYMPGEGSLEEIFILSSSAQFVSISLSLTALFISLMALPLVPQRHRYIFVLSAALLALTILYNTSLSLLQAEFKSGRYSFLYSLSSVLKLFISILMILSVAKSANSLLLANSASLSLVLLFVFRDKPPALLMLLKDRSFRRSLVVATKSMLKYGLPMSGFAIISNMIGNVDRYILGIFRGTEEVGIYGANYYLISGLVALVISPVTLALHPYFMSLWNSGEKAQAASVLSEMVEHMVVLSAVAVAACWLFQIQVAQILLGSRYREASWLLPLILASLLLWQIASYAHKPLEFMEKTPALLTLSSSVAVLGIALDFIFIPLYGYRVVPFILLLLYLTYFFMVFFYGQNYLQWNLKWKRLLSFISIISLFAILLNGINRSLFPIQTGFLSISFRTLLFTGVSTILIYRFAYFKRLFSFIVLRLKGPSSL